MGNEFTSKDQNFYRRKNGFYVRILLTIPIIGLFITALVYGFIYREPNVHYRGKVSKILNGLSHMSISSITMTIVCLLIVAAIIVLLIRSHFEQREIVVGLKFNDDQKELTVTTKTVGETENIRVHKYAELTFKNKKLSDGMDGKQHNTITLIKGPYIAGHIYYVGQFYTVSNAGQAKTYDTHFKLRFGSRRNVSKNLMCAFF